MANVLATTSMKRVMLTDRRMRTPDRPHMNPARGAPKPVMFVRDYGMRPSKKMWTDGTNRLVTPHTAGAFNAVSRMYYVPRKPHIQTPAPSMLGPTKLMNGIPDFSEFQKECALPPEGGTIRHPGRVLPALVQTTQALFGVSACKAGTTMVLATLSDTVPHDAPRYLTHDATAMSSSLASRFRKTVLGVVEPSDPGTWYTSYQHTYQHENAPPQEFLHMGKVKDTWQRKRIGLRMNRSKSAMS